VYICLLQYSCVYVHVYKLCVCICIHLYTNMCVCICIHLYTNMCACIRIHLYTHMGVCICTQAVSMCMYTPTYQHVVCICIHLNTNRSAKRKMMMEGLPSSPAMQQNTYSIFTHVESPEHASQDESSSPPTAKPA
jgi:hypothetical protein